MAQIVKLKRTAVSGRVPTTSNLALGELGINTYDGRIFFEKSSTKISAVPSLKVLPGEKLVLVSFLFNSNGCLFF